jgi:hypothetical protein
MNNNIDTLTYSQKVLQYINNRRSPLLCRMTFAAKRCSDIESLKYNAHGIRGVINSLSQEQLNSIPDYENTLKHAVAMLSNISMLYATLYLSYVREDQAIENLLQMATALHTMEENATDDTQNSVEQYAELYFKVVNSMYEYTKLLSESKAAYANTEQVFGYDLEIIAHFDALYTKIFR